MSDEAPDDSRSVPSFSVPRLDGRLVFLRPVEPGDYPLLRRAELGGDLGVRWRFRGGTPSPEQWAHELWSTVKCQFLVVGRENPTPLGLLVLYRANFQDGNAFVAAETFSQQRPNPLMMLGLGLFLDYVFRCWDFHKLYFEVADYNAGQFDSAVGRFLVEEGRLREHLWYDGRRWDQVMFALFRDTWLREGRSLVASARRPASQRIDITLPPLPDNLAG